MFSRLDHPPVSYEDYRPLIDPKLADDLATVAGEMRQLRVLHLNSTATGGGVAEILQSMVPLSNSLGIETERIVINPRDGQFPWVAPLRNQTGGQRDGKEPRRHLLE